MDNEFLIAGFDLSCNSTGVCIINNKRSIVHAESINPYPLGEIFRLNYIYDRISTILSSYDIKVVGFEKQLKQQRYSYSAGSILPLAEVQGIFKLALAKSLGYGSLYAYSFEPQILKESLTGTRTASKEEMIESLGMRRINHLKSNVVEYAVNDCADAYAAADAALKVYEGKFLGKYDSFIYSLDKGEEISPK